MASWCSVISRQVLYSNLKIRKNWEESKTASIEVKSELLNLPSAIKLQEASKIEHQTGQFSLSNHVLAVIFVFLTGPFCHPS